MDSHKAAERPAGSLPIADRSGRRVLVIARIASFRLSPGGAELDLARYAGSGLSSSLPASELGWQSSSGFPRSLPPYPRDLDLTAVPIPHKAQFGVQLVIARTDLKDSVGFHQPRKLCLIRLWHKGRVADCRIAPNQGAFILLPVTRSAVGLSESGAATPRRRVPHRRVTGERMRSGSNLQPAAWTVA